MVSQKAINDIMETLRRKQGIKFYVNDRFVNASFTQCLLCTNHYSFPQNVLPIGSNFRPVQSKEDQF